jgi:hypothetical protein
MCSSEGCNATALIVACSLQYQLIPLRRIKGEFFICVVTPVDFDNIRHSCCNS